MGGRHQSHLDPASAVASTQVYTTDNAGTAVILNTGAQGWYTFYLLQQGAPVGVKTSYKLTVTYQAPQVPAI